MPLQLAAGGGLGGTIEDLLDKGLDVYGRFMDIKRGGDASSTSVAGGRLDTYTFGADIVAQNAEAKKASLFNWLKIGLMVFGGLLVVKAMK